MPIRPAPQAATARHALVIGASSGTGRVITERLPADGWHMTGLCRIAPTRPVEGLEITQVDVTGLTRLDRVCGGLGAVDVLVYAAGFIRTAPLGIPCAADGAAMWRVYVDAAAFLADRFVPHIPAGDRILSADGRTANGAPARSQYAAIKAALTGMACLWAAKLMPRGITVSVIAPGVTDTPLLHDPARAHTPPRVPPTGRFIVPEEVAAMVAFQIGEYGGTITGQQIVMYGGASLQR